MQVYSHSFWGMNTRFVVVIPSMDQDNGQKISQKIEVIVDAWEKRLSRFLPDNELDAINKSAYNQSISVTNQMGDVLNYCDKYFGLTGGLFDPTYSSVYDALKSKLIDFEIEPLQQSCGWNFVEWEKSASKVRFHSPDVKLDFGGIGKGVALKEVVAFLKTEGVNSAFLSFGESSVAGIGSHPFGEGWPVSIAQSEENFNQDKVLLLCDEFLSVSGMQKMENGSIPHIYNPIKKCLVGKDETVMVKSSCPVEAEALSTSIYMTENSDRENLVRAFPLNQIEIYS